MPMNSPRLRLSNASASRVHFRFLHPRASHSPYRDMRNEIESAWASAKLRARRLFWAAMLLGLASRPLFAATLTVSNLNDSGPGSLRDRIAAAASGDTIVFAVTGTVQLSTEISFSKNLSIAGPGSNLLTVRGWGNLRRVFYIDGGTSVVSGLTITNGRDAIRAAGSTKTRAISRSTAVS